MSAVMNAVVNVGVFSWDILLALANLVTPNLKEGAVTPHGHPGAGGTWPEFIPPKDGDSRSACPALNALANHGILPRDGKNITFKEMNHAVRTTYNFAPSFCFFVPSFSANMLKKKYGKDTFDLAEISLHNGIEHDGSLTREDTKFHPDQGTPHVPFVKELLEGASEKSKDGDPLLTVDDLASFSAKRRHDSQATNPDFSLSTFHKFFGSSNTSTLLTIYGSRVKDLEPILLEERIPEGWESRIRSRWGLTMMAFNPTVLKVEFKTKSKQKTLDRKSD